jgi:hypothetical protein
MSCKYHGLLSIDREKALLVGESGSSRAQVCEWENPLQPCTSSINLSSRKIALTFTILWCIQFKDKDDSEIRELVEQSRAGSPVP